MLEKIIHIYVLLFANTFCEKFNRFLFRLSLGGLGVLNYKTSKISGERSFLKNYLPGKHGALLDIGANEGNYTAEALSCNPGMRVYAFEPHPITFERLSARFENNDSVMTINKGLSSASGILNLYDYPDIDGSSHASLFSDVITDIHGAGNAVAHEVNLGTLDEFVEDHGINEIALLKIDTEGNELEVLRGGIRTLKNKTIEAIHFEFNEMNISSRCFFRDFWKILDQYKFYRLLPNGMLEIRNYTPLSCEIFAYQNIIAILDDS